MIKVVEESSNKTVFIDFDYEKNEENNIYLLKLFYKNGNKEYEYNYTSAKPLSDNIINTLNSKIGYGYSTVNNYVNSIKDITKL